MTVRDGPESAFVAQAYYLGGTLRVTAVVADAAQKSADAVVRVERPYLFIAKINLDAGQDVGIEFGIENIGRTPAILLESSIETSLLAGSPRCSRLLQGSTLAR
jgi:hypothetical protein